MRTTARVEELSPAQVHQALLRNAIILIDVREQLEFQAERIEGALFHPLSGFNPAALPVGDRPLVLHCRSGARSATAVARCIEAGVAVTAHMKGGIQAWKQAGYPTVRSAPGGTTQRR